MSLKGADRPAFPQVPGEGGEQLRRSSCVCFFFIYIFFFQLAKCRVLIPLDLLSAAQFGEAVPGTGLISLLSSVHHPNSH